MADIVRGQNVSAAWEAYVNEKPEDNIFTRHWLLENLRQNGSFKKQNGTVIRANLEYATNPNVKFMSELETLTISRPDTFDNAEFIWKFIGCDVPMTDFERGITAGDARKYNLEAEKLDNMKSSVEEVIEGALFGDGTATSGKSFGGLQLLVANNPLIGTVGLINRATFSFFRNNTISGAGSAFSILLASITTSYNACSNGIGSQNPTFAVTTQTVFEGYESLTPAIERLVRETPSDKLVRGFKGQNVMFKDIPVGYSPQCPSGTWYTLNNRNLIFAYMQWMRPDPDAVRPADAFYDVFKVLTIGNLVTNNPRRLGVVINIA